MMDIALIWPSRMHVGDCNRSYKMVWIYMVVQLLDHIFTVASSFLWTLLLPLGQSNSYRSWRGRRIKFFSFQRDSIVSNPQPPNINRGPGPLKLSQAHSKWTVAPHYKEGSIQWSPIPLKYVFLEQCYHEPSPVGHMAHMATIAMRQERELCGISFHIRDVQMIIRGG